MRRITVGAWRPAEIGPMQVVSGPMGRERVLFEAPRRISLTVRRRPFLTGLRNRTEWIRCSRRALPISGS